MLASPVINVDESISQIGFFGPQAEQLCCITHSERVSLWDFDSVRCSFTKSEDSSPRYDVLSPILAGPLPSAYLAQTTKLHEFPDVREQVLRHFL